MAGSYKTEREYWDNLYQAQEYVYGTEPSEYLRAQAFRLRPGSRALAVGDGEGRNGVWLAGQGLDVVSVDLSPSGIEKARRLAARKNVRLNVECCDLSEWRPKAGFDVVAAIYLHMQETQRPLIHASLASWLNRDGILVLEAFHRRQAPAAGLTGQAAGQFYTAEILHQDFSNLEILECIETLTAMNEGCMHQGKAEVVRLVARRY